VESSGSRSNLRTTSYERYPTNPPVSGGNAAPVTGWPSPDSILTVSRSTSTGLPLVGTPAGGLPSHSASPSRSVSVAMLRTPMNEYLDQLTPPEPAPCSADSSRKLPGPPASLR
jgi:hypothetical protein